MKFRFNSITILLLAGIILQTSCGSAEDDNVPDIFDSIEGDEPINLPYVGLDKSMVQNNNCPNCNLNDLTWLRNAMFFLNISDLNNSTIM